MNNRDTRKKIAEDTLQILEQGYFKTPNGEQVDIARLQAKAEASTIVYTPEASDVLLTKHYDANHNTVIRVTNQTTLNATRELFAQGKEDVLCLNFASARNAGGGFLGGSQAQEESIARATGLYNCQQKASEYYETNRKVKSCVYTDYMIYSPFVPIIKKENGQNMEQLMHCAIITAPAVNTGVVKQREPHRMADIENIMKRRIAKVLAIALEHNHKNLVLGAWGCGVFQNEPKDIARYFREVLETDFTNQFEEIVFAIYAKNERFINAFKGDFSS